MSKPTMVLSILSAFLLTACGPAILYEETHELANSEWTYSETLDFKADIQDTQAIYNLFLKVEHSLEYPYENMYIRIHTTFPDGQTLSEQVSLELADKTGIWQGDCGREACQLSIPIQQSAYFDQPGSYTFRVEQYMRMNPLPGVRKLSFKIEETGERRE